MRCENCGAPVDEGAEACPECSATVADRRTPDAFVDEGVATEEAAEVEPDDAEDAPEEDSIPPVARGRSKGRSVVVALVAVVAVAIIAVGGWLVAKQVGGSTGPEGAAVRMMNAFAAYDATGILDNAVHASMDATDQAVFAKQAADAKTGNKGLAAVKDIKVTKVTLASQDATSATVEFTAQWLTDAAKGTYTKRAETLTVVRQNGVWLVGRLFE
jgi:hypothetical protein